jgi:hypothetical protein
VITLSVGRGDLIADLKSQIQGASGIPVESQQLFIRGRQLLDATFLGDYEVRDGLTVHLVTPDQRIQGTSSDSPIEVVV